MAKAFTASDVDRALTAKNRPAEGRREIAIGGGLELVVFAEGPGRWRFRYRPRGINPATGQRHTQRKVPVGDTDTHSLREAQAKAAELKLRVTQGHDPAQADRAAAREARAAAAAAERQAKLDAAARVTCKDKLDGYRELLASRGRSEKYQREELAQVRLALDSAELLDATPSEITAGHIEKIMGACPVRSRALRFGALDRFLRWAVRGQGCVPATATLDRHERHAPPPARQRVLAAPEIAAIWTAAGELKTPVLRDLVRFLVSTPCREGEAARATWGDIDLPGRAWTQPTSKNGRPHRFPLNDRAAAILAARQEAAGAGAKPADLVFAAPLSGKVFGGWSNLKVSLDAGLAKAAAEAKAQTVAPWRFHDMRRTSATALGELGFDDALVDMLLNHTAAGTRSVLTRTYNVSQRWDDRVRAMNAWGRWIDKALGEAVPEDSATVVDLTAARRRVA